MKEFCRILAATLVVLAVLGLSANAQAPLSNNMPATSVLGQTSLTADSLGKGASGMYNAFGVAVDPTTGKLFVADRNNNRVLRFSAASKLVTGAAAEAVLGQPSLDSIGTNTGGLSASTMNTPVRLYVDGAGRLWVSDYGNRRILRFDNASTKATGAAANGVLGQPDFVTNSAGTTASKMNRTTGVFVDAGGRLWVAERDNNRVLRFDNAASKANGAAADGVLGQPDFTTSSSGLSATKMNGPFGVYVDAGGRLWVAEDGNNRALRFDSAATKTNGAAADGVLGQPDLRTNTATNPTQNGAGNIRGVWGDARGRIYLVEETNARILVFNNAAGLANGANADNVLGQADFTSAAAPTPPTASSFLYPNSMFIDNASNQIWVADAGTNRILRFDVPLGGPTTGVRSLPNQLPAGYALLQNYPNPFNPTTMIRFTLPAAGNVTLDVYNVLGQRVAVLLNQHMAAGVFDVPFNASALSSGVYLYRLNVNGYTSVNKMILMR